MRYGAQSLLLEISFLDDDFLLVGEGCHCLFDGAFGLGLFESELRVTVNDGIVDEVYADFSAAVHLAVTVDCSAGHDFAQKCESVAHIEKAGSDFVNVRPEILHEVVGVGIVAHVFQSYVSHSGGNLHIKFRYAFRLAVFDADEGFVYLLAFSFVHSVCYLFFILTHRSGKTKALLYFISFYIKASRRAKFALANPRRQV